MNNCSDNELVRLLHLSDIKAFDALYFRYEKALYSNIYKLLKDPNAAEDILQEVFIILWEKRGTIDLKQAVSNWLFSVSYNKSVNYLKKILKESLIFKDLNELVTSADDEKEINLREIQFGLIEKAVSQLSPQKRRVFDYCKYKGKSYEETAVELNISKHTVKEYLCEAVVNIKEYIRKHAQTSTAFFCAAILLVN